MSPQMQAMNEADIQQRLTGKLSQWIVKDNALQRIHTCHEYLKSLDLVYQIGQLSEKADHHPDLMLNYKRVTVRYWTHRAKGITELDFDLAEQVEGLIQQAFT